MKIVKIGIIGCGTVGSTVFKTLLRSRARLKRRTGISFEVSAICDKDSCKKALAPDIFTDESRHIIDNPDIDIVVELVGGVDFAGRIVRDSVNARKSVVTANKALISECGRDIFGIAASEKVHLGFEASVAGAIPIIKSIKEGYVGNSITRILGILNGTTNYILTRMSVNASGFSESLLRAQKAGYAEADPSLDISGHDTAHKLSILSSLAFDSHVYWKDIYTEGIDQINPVDIDFAREFGYRIKLLAVAQKQKRGMFDIRVHPTLLSQRHLLATVEGVNNAIYAEGDLLGKSLAYGEGAGGKAAASAVIADIVDIGKKIAGNITPVKSVLAGNKNAAIVPMKDVATRYYFRFTVLDKPGVLSVIAKTLGACSISIASVIQKQECPDMAVPVVMLTHKAKEESVRQAVKEINRLAVIKSPTVIIRLEEF